jgi:hypothetical protein
MRKIKLNTVFLAILIFAGTPIWIPTEVAVAQTKQAERAQIAATQAAHKKASRDKAYNDALGANDVNKVREILIKNGAPSELRVNIQDNRRVKGKTAQRIKIRVTCCPLTIIIIITL